MAYRYRIFDSIEHVDLSEWRRITAAPNGSFAMDPRFIAAVESSIQDAEKSWYIIVYEDGGIPVACTSVSLLTLDILRIADPALARIIRAAPWVFSRLRHWKLIIGGLPIGTGHHTLALAPRSAAQQVLPFLDRLICDLADNTGADAILYKEFGSGDLDWTRPLLELGYSAIPTPPMYFFRPEFEDFAQYCAALKTRYRQQVNRSMRKLSNAGLEVRILTDPQEMLPAYTSEVHALYHQMADRAALNPDVLPVQFLHELALRMRGEVDLIAIYKDTRIVAFGWCVHDPSSYHMLYAGLDYELNPQFDLYFNLMYAGLDRALRKRVSTIEVGLGGDSFKARLGCYSQPLYIFIKGRGTLMSLFVRAAGKSVLTQRPLTAPNRIFKEQVG